MTGGYVLVLVLIGGIPFWEFCLAAVFAALFGIPQDFFDPAFEAQSARVVRPEKLPSTYG